jgi:predicted transposase/invertase (TIGR01784 family)
MDKLNHTIAHYYMDLRSDFAFKKIFADKNNKAILIDLLNTILQNEEISIIDISYLPTEMLGPKLDDRIAICDLLCETTVGEKILIELQKEAQRFFIHRELYYSSHLIQRQATKGKWDYYFPRVFVIGFLNFSLNKKDHRIITSKKLMDIENFEIWTDALTFINIELPKFSKNYTECHTHLDKWLWNFKELSKDSRPAEVEDEGVFMQLRSIAKIATLSKEEQEKYEDSMLDESKLSNFTDYAREEGKKEGLAEGEAKGKQDIARKMLAMGLSIAQISEATGLPPAEIEALQ